MAQPPPRWGTDDNCQIWLGGYRLLVGPRAAQIGCPWPETYGWWECGPPLDLPAGITEEPWPVPPYGSTWAETDAAMAGWR